MILFDVRTVVLPSLEYQAATTWFAGTVELPFVMAVARQEIEITQGTFF